MAWSLLSRLGRPSEIQIVSDGTVTDATARALERLDRSISVVDWREFAGYPDLPEPVVRYAEVHPLGKKLAVLMAIHRWPTIFVDSDIEFFRGAPRLAHLLQSGDGANHYLYNGPGGYDERIISGLDLPEGINSGFFLLRAPLNWDEGLRRLADVADSGGPWTEQTVFAIALSQVGARSFPTEDYVVYWDDVKFPWDHVAGRDVVMRHYLAWIQRWKLWMRGGPAGYRTLPIAVPVELTRWWLEGRLAP
jgi:hypothetical protein